MIEFKVNLLKFNTYWDKVEAAITNIGGDPYLSPAFRNVGIDYLTFTRRRFNINSTGSGDWQSLSSRTIKRRRAKSGGNRFPILKDTEKLYDSLKPGDVNNILEVLPNGVKVGTAIPYATYHQYGTSRMPARTILVFPDQDAQQAMNSRVIAGFRNLLKR